MHPGSAWHLRPRGDVELADRPLDREVVRRAWRLARPYRRRLVWFLVFVVLSSGLVLIPPAIFRTIIDRVIPEGDTGLLLLLAGASVAIAVAAAAISLVQRWFSSSIGEELILDLRSMLFDHVQRMPLAFFTRTQTGALISRLNNDVIDAQRALTQTLGGIVDNAVSLSLTLGVMAALEWRVTVLAVTLLPLFVIPARIVGRRLQKLSRRGMELNAAMTTTMTERFNVSGALLVKLFGSPDHERALFHGRAAGVADIAVRKAMYGRALFASLALIGALASTLVYYIGGRLAISGALTTGTIVQLALYVTQIYGPLTQLSNARVDLMSAMVSFERVFEVVDLPLEIADAEDAIDLAQPRGHLSFRDVWFRYPAAAGAFLESLEGPHPVHDGDASDWILRGIDLDVRPGTMVALVGPSGAGKTSMANLVPRIFDVTQGQVCIDGHDVRQLTLASLQEAIGVVTQDPHLFHDSIANNLRYAKPSATEEEIRAACEAARIAQVIERLPDGYGTIVGERGYRLSGGEKQRVAIARVLLKDPAIVILDEATAHLDSESERHVQAALAETLQGRTSIVIAHRLSTIVDADVILVIDGGEIVERGTHPELLAQDGIYAELARTQLAGAGT